MLRNHGTDFGAILGLAKGDASDAVRIGESDTIMAEVTHAVRSEMAMKLDDVILRRTDLGSGCHPGVSAVRAVAGRMQSLLGWSEERLHSEINATEAILSRHGAAEGAL